MHASVIRATWPLLAHLSASHLFTPSSAKAQHLPLPDHSTCLQTTHPIRTLPLLWLSPFTSRTMLRESTSTTLIMSGESGAGKTETTKHLMNYVAWCSSDEGDCDCTTYSPSVNSVVLCLMQTLPASRPLNCKPLWIERAVLLDLVT